MIIQKCAVSKEVLTDMPVNERNFFLLAGHLANEIVFLVKLATITENSVAGDRVSEKITVKAEIIQALFVYKTLAGKLSEGWHMIRKYYFGSLVSKDYDKLLGDDGQKAIKELKLYFKGSNMISKVRNSYAFHYSPIKMETILSGMKDPDEFYMYVAELNINNFYYVSECAINKEMLYHLATDDLQNSMNELYNNIVLVNRLMLTFIDNFMKAVLVRYLATPKSNPICEEVEIGDVPDLDGLRLPFFVNLGSLADET